MNLDAHVKFTGGYTGDVLAFSAWYMTFGLLVTFGGIGVIVNGVIVYAVAVALGERAENQRNAAGD
ncbi:MAG: hypothetical protein ACR2NH_10740 [Solirubrobacteraceae bacterium]